MWCSAVLLSGVLLVVGAAPVWDLFDISDELGDLGDFSDFGIPTFSCGNLSCPAGTTSCSKKTSTSDDRKTISITVQCFANEQLVHENTTSSPNPNPYSQQSGYEFYGSYTGGSQTINVNGGETETNVNTQTQSGSTTTDAIEKFE